MTQLAVADGMESSEIWFAKRIGLDVVVLCARCAMDLKIMNTSEHAVRFNEGNGPNQIFVPLVLFVNASKRAIELGDAMEAREPWRDKTTKICVLAGIHEIPSQLLVVIFTVALIAARVG